MPKTCITKSKDVHSITSHELIKKWGLKSGLAVMDQGFFSGANFLFNVLLVRWLSAETYGAFSLAFAIYLFSTSFHNALILEPMSVFGTANYSRDIRSYLAKQIIIHAIVTGILGILMSVLGVLLLYFTTDPLLSYAVIGVGLFMPIMLFMWLARRIYYILSEPGSALLISTIYLVALVIGAYILRHFKVENLFAWFGVLGISSFSGFLVLLKFNQSSFGVEQVDKLNWRQLFFDQWTFGRWIVLAAFFYFAATQFQLFITANYIGLEAAGVFRALQNFMLPMMQLLTAISTLAFPSMAFSYGQKNYSEMRRRSFMVSSALIIFSIMYVIFLFFFANPLEQLFYGGKYMAYTWLIPITGLIPLITAIEVGFSLIVRSLQRSVYHAILTFGMSIGGVLSGLVFIPLFGVSGAVFSLITSTFISLVVNIWFYRNWFLALISSRSAN